MFAVTRKITTVLMDNTRPVGLIRTLLRGVRRAVFLMARTIFRLTPMPAKTRWAIRDRLHAKPEPKTANETNLVPEPFSSDAAPGADPKDAYRAEARLALGQFLASDERIAFAKTDTPRVSVVLILYNQAELTFYCLRALADLQRRDLEVILWDNASEDSTRDLLARVDGAITILNDENLHFLRGCNEAVTHASGDFLLFLNNDSLPAPSSIDAALSVFEDESDVGAVGGKIVLLDGHLQEAGNMIWADGSCLGYGRGEHPDAPPYTFRRDVDYVSGVFLLTRRDLFEELGKFDEAFAPAYYEETDYCTRLWEHGYRVVYEPEARVTHFEYGSAGTEKATDLMRRNQTRFLEKHAPTLARHLPPAVENIIAARTHRSRTPRILYIDDKFPHLDLGQGFPRSNFILSVLADQRFNVTLFATNQAPETPEARYRDISPHVECLTGSLSEDLRQLLEDRRDYFDFIFVSRPHNMEGLRHVLSGSKDAGNRTQVIYDAEALFCSREIAQRKLEGKTLSPDRVRSMIEDEVSLADIAHTIVTVSETERAHFDGYVSCNISVVGHAMESQPGPAPFKDRKDFVFVGAIAEEDSPNADSMRWFISEVWPLVRDQLADAEVNLKVVGLNEAPSVQALAAEDILIVGRVDDLESVYHSARVIVIPTRYAAGIPYKAHEAASFGVPMVTTALIAEQLQWQHKREVLSADTADPAAFAQCCVSLYSDETLWNDIRSTALAGIARDCSVEAQASAITALFSRSEQEIKAVAE